MTNSKPITRRAALARLGLSAASVYMSPGILGISKAHAASSVSTPSPVSPATPPSPPSTPSPPSKPSGPSQPENRTGGRTSSTSGPSTAGTCQQSSLPAGGQITRRDYARAQQAIARGDARPLREVLSGVQSRYPGRMLRVGFSESGQSPTFRVLIVNRSGAILSVTVDAKSGQITNVRNC